MGEAEDICIIETDPDGDASLYNRKETRHLQPLLCETWADIKTAGIAARDGNLEALHRRYYRSTRDRPFKTVGLDTISTARDIDLREQRNGKDKGDQNIYDINNTRILDLVHNLLRSKYNVILVGHVREMKDSQGNTILTRPALSDNLWSTVCSQVSAVLYLEKVELGKVSKRVLHGIPTDNKIIVKNRYGSLIDKIENPKWLDVENAIAEWRLRSQSSELEPEPEPEPDKKEELDAEPSA